MADKIYDENKNIIEIYKECEKFFTTDFIEIATLTTIHKCLGRQTEEGIIRRVMDGT